jgi:hypothetical protein
MKHLVIIRFNAGFWRYAERFEGIDWLEHRLKFFRAFTVPSLRAQTNQNFTTVILADPNTPDSIQRELRNVGLVYLTEEDQRRSVRNFSYRLWLSDILGREKCVVTSRLDSDDGYARNYIQHAQSVIRAGNDNMVYNNGVVWVEGKFFLKTDEAAPFLTKVEYRDRVPAPPDTVYALRDHYFVLKVRHQSFDADPMWLMACHDHNLLNTPGELGRELSLEEVNQYFEVDTSWLE